MRRRNQTPQKPTKLFLWNWTCGGYNSCRAVDRDEAIEKANAMASMLKPSLSTLRECTYEELEAEDKRWGPYD